VATPGVADTHGFTAAGTPEPVKVVVLPTQVVNVPVIVGKEFTVINTEAELSNPEQLFTIAL